MAFLKNIFLSLFSFLRQLSAKMISIVSVSVVIFAVALLSLQVILKQPVIQKKMSEQLTQWSGGNLSFSGAIHLNYFPQLSVQAEHVFLRDVKRLPNIDKMRARRVTAHFEWWPLLLGRLNLGSLSLEEPEIYLSKENVLFGDEVGSNRIAVRQRHLEYIFQSIGDIPFTEIEFKKALLVVPNNLETGRDLYKFAARFAKEDEHYNIAGRGHFVWKDKKVGFEGFTSLAENSLSHGVIPLNLKLDHHLGKVKFSGQFEVVKGQSFEGVAIVKGLKGRKFAHLLGYDLSEGRIFSDIDIKGTVKWRNDRLEFKKAKLFIDGNNADGSLVINYKPSKPIVSGQLSFRNLNLREYLSDKSFLRHVQSHYPVGGQTKNNQKLGLVATGLQGQVAANTQNHSKQSKGQPKTLIDAIDFDLRLMADQIQMKRSIMQNVVATMFNNNNKMIVHIADAKMFDGRIYGGLTRDYNEASPYYDLKLSFKGIQTKTLVSTMTRKTFIDGRSDITMALTGRGDRKDELLRTVSGKIIVASASNGYIGLDFAKLFQRKRELLNNGKLTNSEKKRDEWAAILKKKTAFNTMTAKLVFDNGQLKSNHVRINENGYLTAILGQADLVRNNIKWLFDRKMVSDTAATPYGVESTRRVVTLVEGALDSPVIKRHYVGVNAALADMDLLSMLKPFYSGVQKARKVVTPKVQGMEKRKNSSVDLISVTD